MSRHDSTPAAPATADDESSVAKADAPSPDHPAKPDSPTDLTKPSWRYVLMKTFREFQRDEVTDMAAALTYWAVLAVAPAALALISLLGVFGDAEQIVEDVMAQVERVAPGLELETIEPIIESAVSQQGAGVALVTGLLLALWSASGYVNAFSRAMNRMYEIDEGRPIWKLRPVMLLVTLVMLVLVALVCTAMVLSGPVAAAIGNAVGLSDVTVAVWNIVKWPVIVLVVAVIIAILYYATPNVQQPRFRWLSVGSFVAILIWAVATLGFAFYVANFSSYGATYGSLAGMIVFLLWLWITNNALLFGAELDAELERTRQLQAGIPAEETIQLPPRDTQASEKKRRKRAEDILKGRSLRLSRGRHDDPEDVGKRSGGGAGKPR